MRLLEIRRRIREGVAEARRMLRERRRAREAARRFRDIVKAEKLYGEWELEYVELSVEDFLKMYGVKPLFRDLWHMAEHCTDVRGCYRMLAYLKLEGREDDLKLVKDAVRMDADVEMLVTLLYQGKREEVAKLLRR
ncbi:MAG: hypothetical protein RXO32_10535 [Thermoproteus sp.]